MGNMLLVTSGAAAALAKRAGGPAPRVAGVSDVAAAAEVLQDSKELLLKLKKKLLEKQAVSVMAFAFEGFGWWRIVVVLKAARQ